MAGMYGLAMLIKSAFNLTYRQTEGKIKGVISLIKDKDLKIPDYTSISKKAKVDKNNGK